jgi:hypothetical protein
MRSKKHLIVMGVFLATGATGANAASAGDAGKFSLTGGVDYSSGKYGTDTTTDILSIPVTAAYDIDRWSFKLTVPYINVSGSDAVIPGIGKTKNQNPKGRGHGHGQGSVPPLPTLTPTGSASGLGDITASAGYLLFTNTDRSFGVDLTGKVKFGTANADKGLGTGKNDYGLSVDAFKTVGDWTLFGGLGLMKYTSSKFIQLKNGFDSNLGAEYKLNPSNNIGASYYYRQKITVGSDGAPKSELTGYWNHQLNDTWRLQTYVLGGFANGSPDYGVGAAVRYGF